MTFKDLEIIAPILEAVKAEGYTQPTPIQEQAIPILLQGKDLLGVAQTGTGKTAAFAIPILQHLYHERQQNRAARGIRASDRYADEGTGYPDLGEFFGLRPAYRHPEYRDFRRC